VRLGALVFEPERFCGMFRVFEAVFFRREFLIDSAGRRGLRKRLSHWSGVRRVLLTANLNKAKRFEDGDLDATFANPEAVNLSAGAKFVRALNP
jgi:hypothetical protein